MAFSFWEQQTFIGYPDVCIIGSGIVGLNAAIVLKTREPALDVMILERGFLPSGASTRNAGFACFGSMSELLMDLETSSEQEVFSLVEKRWKGLIRLRQLLGDQATGYEALGGYEVFSDPEEELFNTCVSQLESFNRKLSGITGEKNTYVPADNMIGKFGFNKVRHMILNTGEGQIDTGMMMHSLIEKAMSKGIRILNGISVKGFEKRDQGISLLIDDNTSIQCANLLVTTNGFARQLLPAEDVAPARAQVLITEPVSNCPLQGSFHYDKGYYYFRNVGSRILLGGGRNLDFKGEETYTDGTTSLIQNKLEDLLKNMILPETDFSIAQRWSGIMGLGSKKKSIVKKVSSSIWCAVRMGGMGVAIGSLTGEEAAELILSEI